MTLLETLFASGVLDGARPEHLDFASEAAEPVTAGGEPSPPE